jgi:uncharacterized protein YbjT (DUF2867 family)
VAVRSKDKGAAWKKRGAEVVVVEDIADADALARAFENVTGAFALNPPNYNSHDDMCVRAEQVATAIIEAARRARVPFLKANGLRRWHKWEIVPHLSSHGAKCCAPSTTGR